MTIHTVQSWQAVNRRLNRHLRRVEHVLTAMRRGNALHLEFNRGGALWTLTDGTTVLDTAARAVIEHACVCSVGDGLFKNGPAQTWRWIER